MASPDDERLASDPGQAGNLEQTADGQPAGPGNCHRSGGPRSEAGKEAASLNSITHGILSGHLILKGENRDDFDRLLVELCEALKPVGAFEQYQVERIAVGIWRQRRLVRAETEQIARQQVQLRAEERLIIADAIEALGQDLNASGGSDVTLEQVGKKVYAASQAEFSLNEDFINNLDIKDWELLEDKAPNILALLLVEAEKEGQSVINFLSGYASIVAWVKAKMAQQKQALPGLARVSTQGAATNGESNNTRDAKPPGSPEKNTADIAMKSRWIPSNMEVLGRYQTMLDNQVNKALNTLFEVQKARRKENKYTGEDKVIAEQ